METKTFDKSSWTYRFLAWPGKRMDRILPQDICELRTRLIAKAIATFGWVIIFTVYSSMMTSAILQFGSRYLDILSIYREITPFVLAGQAAISITVALLIIVGLIYLLFYWHERKCDKQDLEYEKEVSLWVEGSGPQPIHPRNRKRKPNIIKALYLSWKEKLCYKVEFK